MRKGALIGLGATFAAGLVLLAVLAATRQSPLVYSIGSGPGAAVAPLKPGDEACQGPLSPPADAFDRVVISLGTYFRPGEPVEVIVRDAQSRRVLSSGRLAGGYPDIAQAPEHAVPISSTTLRAPAEVCVRNTGRRRVAVYGSTGLAHRTSTAIIDGKPVSGSDLAVRLERAAPRSLLNRLPQAFDHAALFKPGFVGPWTFWVLAAIVLLVVPALLGRALADALRDERA
jgi:hypothetical protein